MGAERGPRHSEAAALEALYADLDGQHIAPFWAIDAVAGHDEDRQVMDRAKAVPFIWKYQETDRAAAPALGPSWSRWRPRSGAR